jgi:hypothetical protein
LEAAKVLWVVSRNSTIPYHQVFCVGCFHHVQDTYPEDDDYKFVNSTWYDFFNDYLLTYVTGKIVYDCAVTNIQWNETMVTGTLAYFHILRTCGYCLFPKMIDGTILKND